MSTGLGDLDHRLAAMIREIEAADAIYQPSTMWTNLGALNRQQLERGGPQSSRRFLELESRGEPVPRLYAGLVSAHLSIRRSPAMLDARGVRRGGVPAVVPPTTGWTSEPSFACRRTTP